MEFSITNCPNCGFDLDKVQGVLEEDTLAFCLKCQFPLQLVAGKYRMVREVWRGGSSIVYLAHHIHLDRDAERVVKVIRPEIFKIPGMEHRFRREVQITSALSQQNDHIVRIYDDFGSIPKLGHFYIMEFLHGETLSQLLDQLADLPPLPFCFYLMQQLCDTMQFAHDEGVVHRDLKPHNLMMVQRKNDPYFLKVFDFGIAKPLSTEELAVTHVTQGSLGTPAYMAPEQCLNQPTDVRTDIYAMGIMFYEMLVGFTPFLPPEGDVSAFSSAVGIIEGHLTREPPSPHTLQPERVSEELAAVVLRMLAKKPEHRYQSVEELRTALDQVVSFWPSKERDILRRLVADKVKPKIDLTRKPPEVMSEENFSLRGEQDEHHTWYLGVSSRVVSFDGDVLPETADTKKPMFQSSSKNTPTSDLSFGSIAPDEIDKKTQEMVAPSWLDEVLDGNTAAVPALDFPDTMLSASTDLEYDDTKLTALPSTDETEDESTALNPVPAPEDEPSVVVQVDALVPEEDADASVNATAALEFSPAQVSALRDESSNATMLAGSSLSKDDTRSTPSFSESQSPLGDTNSYETPDLSESKEALPEPVEVQGVAQELPVPQALEEDPPESLTTRVVVVSDDSAKESDDSSSAATVEQVAKPLADRVHGPHNGWIRMFVVQKKEWESDPFLVKKLQQRVERLQEFIQSADFARLYPQCQGKIVLEAQSFPTEVANRMMQEGVELRFLPKSAEVTPTATKESATLPKPVPISAPTRPPAVLPAPTRPSTPAPAPTGNMVARTIPQPKPAVSPGVYTPSNKNGHTRPAPIDAPAPGQGPTPVALWTDEFTLKGKPSNSMYGLVGVVTMFVLSMIGMLYGLSGATSLPTGPPKGVMTVNVSSKILPKASYATVSVTPDRRTFILIPMVDNATGAREIYVLFAAKENRKLLVFAPQLQSQVLRAIKETKDPTTGETGPITPVWSQDLSGTDPKPRPRTYTGSLESLQLYPNGPLELVLPDGHRNINKILGYRQQGIQFPMDSMILKVGQKPQPPSSPFRSIVLMLSFFLAITSGGLFLGLRSRMQQPF